MHGRQMSVIYRLVIFAYCDRAHILQQPLPKPRNIEFSWVCQSYPQAHYINPHTTRDITDTFGISRTLPSELTRYITGHLFVILRTFSPCYPAPGMGLTSAKRLNLFKSKRRHPVPQISFQPHTQNECGFRRTLEGRCLRAPTPATLSGNAYPAGVCSALRAHQFRAAKGRTVWQGKNG